MRKYRSESIYDYHSFCMTREGVRNWNDCFYGHSLLALSVNGELIAAQCLTESGIFVSGTTALTTEAADRMFRDYSEVVRCEVRDFQGVLREIIERDKLRHYGTVPEYFIL